MNNAPSEYRSLTERRTPARQRITDAAREKFLRHTWRALSEAAHERSAVQGNSLDIERLRRLNRATVERYMAMKGAERLQRHSLFVEDGCAGNWTTESGEPLVFRGHESLRRLAEWLERCFPDWEWHNVRIFETEDPNHFWVECDGRGKALVPGYPQGYCENHYIHSFELENGRIKRNREFMNPIQKLRALGIAVPQIKRDGIPT
ncbi:PhzA/PhzB family protein [Pseudomonas aeruginosa]|nr:PhzA/PhzB family protein [Pseudomonas aeruginosa]